MTDVEPKTIDSNDPCTTSHKVLISNYKATCFVTSKFSCSTNTTDIEIDFAQQPIERYSSSQAGEMSTTCGRYRFSFWIRSIYIQLARSSLQPKEQPNSEHDATSTNSIRLWIAASMRSSWRLSTLFAKQQVSARKGHQRKIWHCQKDAPMELTRISLELTVSKSLYKLESAVQLRATLRLRHRFD